MLPPPVPAALGLPDCLKAVPKRAFNILSGREENTVERCPPFVDAMTSGRVLRDACIAVDSARGGRQGFRRGP